MLTFISGDCFRWNFFFIDLQLSYSLIGKNSLKNLVAIANRCFCKIVDRRCDFLQIISLFLFGNYSEEIEELGQFTLNKYGCLHWSSNVKIVENEHFKNISIVISVDR